MCEEVKLIELAEEFGTPLYVYSKSQLLENYETMKKGLPGPDSEICYALKANANLSILRVLADAKAGADIASAGELFLALKAGFKPEKIVFTGVGKREDEIEFALKENVFCIHAESFQELQAISRVAYRLGRSARIGLRMNPEIDAESHPYISTGMSHHKFGIDASKALEAFQYASSLPAIEIIGIHTHIGSQILKIEPYAAVVTYLMDLVKSLREAGMSISHVDVGGGFGVQYEDAIRHEALKATGQGGRSVPAMSDFFRTLIPISEIPGLKIWIEPGRSMIANAGVLLTKVLYVKENSKKKFVIVDAGMNDLIRPSLYDAFHQVIPLKIETYEQETVDLVGPVCETGDFFARDRMMLRTKQHDYLSIMTAGAYGYVSSSNYNGRLRPAEVMVSGERVKVIRPRETFEDLS